MQSLEDKALKENLTLAVSRVMDQDAAIRKSAIDLLNHEVDLQFLAVFLWLRLCWKIRTSTSSMTSVPKPLKFLHPHYEPLKQFYTQLPSGDPTRRCVSWLLCLVGVSSFYRD